MKKENLKNEFGIINFLGYKVLEVYYQLNESFSSKDLVDMSFELEHSYEISEYEMKVQFGVKVFDNAEENDYPFEMRVVLLGIFSFENDVDGEKFLPNALAILFPYIRSIVSTYTALANISPLILPTINILNYIQKISGDDEKLVE